jgi:8-oxo-dGTP diphosphatase
LPTLLVVAGILFDGSRVLLTQRKAGSHLAGLWEFPGGKVNDGEDPKEALVRELTEELGVEAAVGDILNVTYHRYEETGKSVLLLFYEFRLLPTSAPPSPIDVAAIRWAEHSELDDNLFPPADIEVLHRVRERLRSSK